jgi:hypothetical protein
MNGVCYCDLHYGEPCPLDAQREQERDNTPKDHFYLLQSGSETDDIWHTEETEGGACKFATEDEAFERLFLAKRLGCKNDLRVLKCEVVKR